MSKGHGITQIEAAELQIPYMEDIGAPRAMRAQTSRMVPGTQGTPVSSATPYDNEISGKKWGMMVKMSMES
jgi:hypothetical protein